MNSPEGASGLGSVWWWSETIQGLLFQIAKAETGGEGLLTFANIELGNVKVLKPLGELLPSGLKPYSVRPILGSRMIRNDKVGARSSNPRALA